MGIGGEDTSDGFEGGGSEDRTFACPYCGEEYDTAHEQGMCQASHFEGTGSVTRKARSEDKKKNIVDNWKRGEKK